MKLNDTFAQTMRGPICQAWQAIAEEGIEATNAEAIEMAIDADRLATFHSQEANDMLYEAIKEHGYKPVLDLLKKNISLV
jgi:hypothetical protein